MEIVVGNYKAARPHHTNGGVEGEPKWMSTGRYTSTLALAMQDIYEVDDVLAVARRIERSIERAAKDALAKEER